MIRDHAWRCAVLATSTLFLAFPITAQQKDNAGIGTVKYTVDASNSPTVRDALIIGVCYVNGNYYVSGRGDGTQRMIYEYDTEGTLLREMAAPPISQGTTNGVRGMATDGTNIIGGSAVGLLAFDTNAQPVNTLITANNPAAPFGPQPVTGAAYAALTNIFRGVAYDPGGNAGNGSIWVSDNAVGLPIIEIDLQGNVLQQFPDQGWEAYGLARDPMTGNLWVNSLVDGANANGGPIFELDTTTGIPTGVQFAQAHTDFHAGIDVVPGGDPAYQSFLDLVAVNQSYADIYAVHRVHLHQGLHGKDEARLEARLNANPFTTGNAGQFATGDTLEWQDNAGTGTSAGSLAFTVFNISDDAYCDGQTNVPFLPGSPIFPELRAQNAISTPRSLFAQFVSTGIGAAPQSATIPPGLFDCFDVIRMQGIYIELGILGQVALPFVATNEAFVNYHDEASCSIVVSADGANSFVGGVPIGFWKVQNLSGPDILEVTFDWERSTNPFHLNDDHRFDLDESSMADLFTAGNSTDVACLGTYWNGSDVTTGLVYDSLNFPTALCNVTNPNPNSGFIAIGPGDPINNGYYGITFRFTDFQAGETFEFDCDTDGGGGVTGADMAGMYIEIKLADGRTLCGELRADPNNATRSSCGW